MKKIFIFLILSSCTLHSQWIQEIRLTNDPNSSVTSYNNAWCIASSGNFIHTVWTDNRTSNNEIFYKRSTDCGNTWGTDYRLTNYNSFLGFPCIAVSGLNVYTAWHYGGEIYMRISPNGGLNWGENIRVTNFSQPSSYPSIAVSGSFLHITWVDFRNQHEEIFYKHSTDNGLTWGPDISLSSNYQLSWYSSVAASNSIVHVVWGYESGGRICYNRSSDGGNNWSNAVMLTSTQSYNPCVSSSGSNVHVVWVDGRDGNYEIYYKRSANEGISWEPDVRLTNDTSSSEYPNIFVSGSAVHVVWYDRRSGNYEIYYKCSKNNGVNWEPDIKLTNDVHSSKYPSVSACSSAVHVVWSDDRDGNNEIYYTQNPTGNIVSLKNRNTAVPGYFSLYQNYPNPFNLVTKIKFDVPLNVKGKTANVRLVINDILGKEVAVIVNQHLHPDSYEVTWDASNYPSGVYFYKLTADNYTDTKKMILLK